MKTLQELTVVELKALIYDLSVERSKIEQKIQLTEQELDKKLKEDK
jgi:hypothetical protein